MNEPQLPPHLSCNADYWRAVAVTLADDGGRPDWWDRHRAAEARETAIWRAEMLDQVWGSADRWVAFAEARSEGHELDVALMIAVPDTPP